MRSKLLVLVLAVVFLFAGTAFAQMSGTYYIGAAGTAPGPADPEYATLKAACDAVMAAGVGGDITFLITSDLTEPTNVDLAVDTDGHTIVFKPFTGITPTVTFTQAGDNAGSSGRWVIGQLNTSGAPLVPTHNIVIDGSNTVDGTSRDLSFVSAAGGKLDYNFRIRGNSDNITIKNCNMSGVAAAYAIWVNPVFTSPDNFNPDNLTIENCSISSLTHVNGTAIHVAMSGTTTAPMEGLVVKGNDIFAHQRGVFLNGRTNETLIEGNTFEINHTATGYVATAVMGNIIHTTGKTYILGNDFKVNGTANVAASQGMRVIVASGGGTFIVANNFFRGFSAPSAGGTASEIVGIRCGSAVEAYYNTFVLNDINAVAGSIYRAINVAAGTPIIKNNIFVIEEDDFSAYAISGAPVSDYNNFYLKGETNAKVHPLYATLVDLQGAGMDANSVSKPVEFVSADDLHLAGVSVGDGDLIGTPIAGITTDIDGDVRSTLFPYMGADEADTELVPPPPAVFFSEYIEGSSYNKALEIYNGTGKDIDLKNFRIAQSANGGGWAYWKTFPDSTILAAGDVWVIVESRVNAALFDPADADESFNAGVVGFNGDDARAIEWTYDDGTTWVMLDVIGIPTERGTGGGWEVAGVYAATVDQTLVRKETVVSGNTDWAASAGTDEDDSEWYVLPNNVFAYLGSHPSIPEVDTVSTLADLMALDPDSTIMIVYNGSALVTFTQSYRNQKFIQDETAAILIDDNLGKITTALSRDDGVSNLKGLTSVYNNMVQFLPAGNASVSVPPVIVPAELSLAEYISDYDDYKAQLVTLKEVWFVDADDTITFANGQVYKVTDGVDTIDFRTSFYDVDYITTVIPVEKIDLTGILNTTAAGNYITARDLDDMPPFDRTLAGEYYIPQGVNPQGFASLKDAVDHLNAFGVSGPVTFLLDADTLREASFTFTADLDPNEPVVVKPAPGKDVVLIVTPGLSKGNGAQMIGFDKGNVVFDGSNDGSGSRNLLVTTETNDARVPFGLNTADADNVVIKNLVIENIDHPSVTVNFRYGVVINDVGGVTGHVVENCQVGSAEKPIRRDGLAPWGGGATANEFSFIGNEIYAGIRGITTIYLANTAIVGNTINMMPETAGHSGVGVPPTSSDAYNHGMYITGCSGELVIARNTVNMLEKANNAASYMIGIAFAGNSEAGDSPMYIINNMINVGAADETRPVYGIASRSNNPIGNLMIYHNTILVNETASTLVGYGIGTHTGTTGAATVDLKNNIIINNHTGNAGSAAIGLTPSATVLVSDQNVLLADQALVNFKGTTYADLAAWQATGADAFSVSKDVDFVSATDLHLVDTTSAVDQDLVMPAIGIAADIDGDPRPHPNFAYAGADEGAEITGPLAAGDYYIPSFPGTQGFVSLKAAVDAVNAMGAEGPVNFLLNADTLREASFTFAADSQIVVKPAPGKDVVLIVAPGASKGNGAQMIGFDKGNVVFDGSNDGSGSRNLLVTTETNDARVPFGLNTADADNVVIKNLVIENIDHPDVTVNFRYGVVINDVGGVTGHVVENCQVGSAAKPIRRDGLAPWGGGATANEFSFIGNEIYAGIRGITTIYLDNTEIIGNTINMMPATAGHSGTGVPPTSSDGYNHGMYITGCSGGLIIEGNVVNMLEKANNAASYMIGIAFAGNSEAGDSPMYIINNMINVGAADETCPVYGIASRSNNPIGNLAIYHNTIVVNDTESDKVSYGIGTHTTTTGVATIDLKNNIIINNHSGNAGSAAIGLTPSAAVLTSDQNVLLADQALVNFKGTTYADLAAWQATERDVNSVSKEVTFVAADDLHLADPSDTDLDLVFGKIEGIDTDIDGDPRIHPALAYAGADEGSAYSPPVDVVLNVIMKEQVRLGVLNLALGVVDVIGTFNDWEGTAMADFDGDTTYSVTLALYPYSDHEFKFRINGSTVEDMTREITVGTGENEHTYWFNDDTLEVSAVGIPVEFALHQNYPNPFNPSTTINFDLPSAADVKLIIYDITGRKVRTLVNGYVDAGYKKMVWNGRDDFGNGVATGMYIYRIHAGDFVDVKKMTFLK